MTPSIDDDAASAAAAFAADDEGDFALLHDFCFETGGGVGGSSGCCDPFDGYGIDGAALDLMSEAEAQEGGYMYACPQQDGSECRITQASPLHTRSRSLGASVGPAFPPPAPLPPAFCGSTADVPTPSSSCSDTARNEHNDDKSDAYNRALRNFVSASLRSEVTRARVVIPCRFCCPSAVAVVPAISSSSPVPSPDEKSQPLPLMPLQPPQPATVPSCPTAAPALGPASAGVGRPSLGPMKKRAVVAQADQRRQCRQPRQPQPLFRPLCSVPTNASSEALPVVQPPPQPQLQRQQPPSQPVHRRRAAEFLSGSRTTITAGLEESRTRLWAYMAEVERQGGMALR